MKDFDELVNDYDDALEKARKKLPPVQSHDHFRIKILVRVPPENPLQQSDLPSDTTADKELLEFTFEKEVVEGVAIGWIHIK